MISDDMILAVSHDVLAEWLGVPARIAVVSNDFEVCFSVTVQDVANQDLRIVQSEPKRAGYCEIQTDEKIVDSDRTKIVQVISNYYEFQR